MRAAYRNDEDAARLHLAALLERRRAQVAAVPGDLLHIYVRRAARSAAGKAAIGGAASVAALAACAGLCSFGNASSGRAVGDALLYSGVSCSLVAAWVTAAAAYGIGRRRARARLRDLLAEPADLNGDVHADRARIEAEPPDAQMRRLLAAQEQRSVALPLAGFLLLGPLSLHLVLYAGSRLLAGSLAASLDDFGRWIVMSLVLVSHCHLLLAALAFRFARRLGEMSANEIVAKRTDGGGHALAVVALSSLFPGAILFLVPPLVVAATGVFVVLPGFAFAQRRLLEERRLLEA